MGTCCNKVGNGNPNSGQSQKVQPLPKNKIKQVQPTSKITAEDVDNEIHKWVEKTKRNHKKSLSESNNITHSNNHDTSYNESEIAKDFSDDNKIVRTFSEISSTIHLTNLTRDFYMSRVNNITSVNNPQSITLFNVLEELEENCAGSNNEKIPMTTKPVKIYVTNTSNRTPKMSKDFSLSGNKCNSKLGQIATQLNIIVNRSNNVISDDNEEESKGNVSDDAKIYSNGISISSEEEYDKEIDVDNIKVDVENVFYHVKRNKFFDFYENNNYIADKNEDIINGIFLWKRNNVNIGNNHINYPLRYDNVDIEWKTQTIFDGGVQLSNMKIENVSLKANKVHNSSLLSALISIISCDIRLRTSMMSSIVLRSKGIDINSVYVMQSFLNGNVNNIAIDNKIPFTALGECIFSHVTPQPLSMYVNIIEKIFFIMNRYNKNYISTSAIDLHRLIGWYPESYSLREKINKEIFWNNFYTNFVNGKLFVSFANNDSNGQYECDSNRVYHNVYYTVVSAQKETMILRMKSTFGNLLPLNTKQISPDTFDISFSYACEIFSDVFLNWNPNLYPHCYSLSSSYTMRNIDTCSNFFIEDYCVDDNNQFIIHIPPHRDDLEIKILLQKKVSSLDAVSSISYRLYKYEGFPIIYPDNPLRTYSSSTQRTLISDFILFDPSDTNDEYVIVVMKGNDSERSVDDKIYFDLKLYCDCEIKVVEMTKRKKYNKYIVNDVWNLNYYNRQSDILYDIFLKFPQYKLTVINSEIGNKENHIQIVMETKVLSNIMICLIDSDGENLFHVTADQFLERKSSNIFSNSFSFLECVIPSGKYLLLCLSSNENDGTTSQRSRISNFSLSVFTLSSKTSINMERLYPISRYANIERVFGEWNKKNNRYVTDNTMLLFKNPSYQFSLNQKTRMYFYLKEYHKNKTINFSSIPHIFLALYKVDSSNSKFSIIYDGANLPCSFWGFYIEDIELEPGKYVIICLNHTKYESLKYELLIHSNYKISTLKEFKFLNYRKNNYQILSKWNGTVNNTTKYRVVPYKDTVCDFEIFANCDDKVGIGIIVVEINGVLDSEDDVVIDKKCLSEIKEDIFLVKDIVLKCDKDYLFLPYSNQSKRFNVDINVNSNEDLQIKEIMVNVDFVD